MSSDQALEYKKEGNQLFSQQKWDEAIISFSKAIELDPSSHVFYSNRSACYSELQKYELALNDANTCIEIKSDWPKGYSRKGHALFKLNKLSEAKKAYEEGLKLDSSNESLKTGLSLTENAMNNTPNPFAKLFGDNIWGKIANHPVLSTYLKDEGFVNKIRLLQSNPSMYMKTMMNDPQIIEVMKMLLAEMGIGVNGNENKEKENGVNDYEKEVEKEEVKIEKKEVSESDKAKEAGNVYYKSKEFEKAIAEYTKAIELDPSSPIYLNNRAAAYMMLNKDEEAKKDCHKAIEIGNKIGASLETMAKIYDRIGNIHMKKKEYSEAIKYFDKSILECSSYKIKMKLKKVKKLYSIQKERDLYNPEEALKHKDKGNEYFKEGKWKESIDEYTESIKRNPKDCKVYSNRAGAFCKVMSWDNARKDCEKCIEIDPTFSKAYLRLSNINIFLKEYHNALKTVRKGLEIEPNSSQLIETRNKLMQLIYSSSNQAPDPERQARAMKDPEIKKILSDPNMMKVLEDMKNNPSLGSEAMKDKDIRENIEILVAAGVVQLG